MGFIPQRSLPISNSSNIPQIQFPKRARSIRSAVREHGPSNIRRCATSISHLSATTSTQTLQAGLTSAIPTSTPFTGFIVLPDGNIQLPNGTIINPSGQVVGQAGASASSSPTSFVNPYDTFTGTAKVQKIFSYGIVDLGVSVQRVDYENRTAQPISPTRHFPEMAHFGSDLSSMLILTANTTSAILTRARLPAVPDAGQYLNRIPNHRWNRNPTSRAVSCFGIFWPSGIGVTWICVLGG